MSELRRLRLDCRLSVDDLADRSGVSRRQIINIENGTTVRPRMETLTALADSLEVSPSSIDPLLTKDAAA